MGKERAMTNGSNWWRALIAIVVVIALPALALPKVNTAINDWLYGDAKQVVPQMPELKMQSDETTSGDDDHAEQDQAIARLDFQDDVAGGGERQQDIRSLSFQEDRSERKIGHEAEPERDNAASQISAPPLLPAIAPLNQPLSRPADSLARVRDIKDQLATWGAEYILLETLDQGQKFRFCCLMADGQDQQVTFPFEATAPDAAVAAESVLSAVQSWRKQQGLSQ